MPHQTFFKQPEGSAYLKRRQAKHQARMVRDKAAQSIDRAKAKSDADLRLAVWVRDQGKSRASGTPVYLSGIQGFERMEAHHVIFRSQGGTDTLDNLVALTVEEHQAIHDRKMDCEGNPNGDLTFSTFTFKTDGSRELVRTWVSGCQA